VSVGLRRRLDVLDEAIETMRGLESERLDERLRRHGFEIPARRRRGSFDTRSAAERYGKTLFHSHPSSWARVRR
jgi:hypothetical protein